MANILSKVISLMKRDRSFKTLSEADRAKIAQKMRAIVSGVNVYNRGRYAAVTTDMNLRRKASIETDGEDSAMTATERARMLGLTRNQMRNGETLPAVLKQFEFNVIGTVGGKASFSFGEGYEESAKTMQTAFARWASRCEFFRGENLGKVLKLAMRTMMLGGDVALVFDEGAFEDSGKILGFESDNIANIPDSEFSVRFPVGWSQSQGFVYDEFHRLVGCFVSPSQRGVETLKVYDQDGRLAILPLIADPSIPVEDLPFVIFANTWRFNQGRGVTPLASSIGSTTDLEDVTKYEVQAAKFSAQKVAQVIDSTPAESQGDDLGSLDPNIAAPIEGEDDAALVAEIERLKAEAQQEQLSLEHIEHAGAMYDILPPNLKMEMLSPEHPNSILPEFVKWLQGRVGWSLGVGSVYATGKADKSYTAFRGEQVMSWPAFEDMQHELETKILDWIVPKWYGWSVRHGLIPANLPLPEDWQFLVKWNWPKIREVNQVDEQNAIKLALGNFTKSYRDVLGPDYKEKLSQIATEKRELEALGLPDIRMQTVSGQLVSAGEEE